MLFKEMTSDQRRAAYDDRMEAVFNHGNCFAARPYRGGRYDNMAWSHMQKCEREAGFIKRVAKSQGDAWAA